MSFTTELVIAGGTAIAGGVVTPFLAKKNPRYRLIFEPGPSHNSYWAYQGTYKVQRLLFGRWWKVSKHWVQTDQKGTHLSVRGKAVKSLKSRMGIDVRDNRIVFDSGLDPIEDLTTLE